jgi:NAD(P)-dependent dehydrogenase (short-subunit alcohol dehydrogenase family)
MAATLAWDNLSNLKGGDRAAKLDLHAMAVTTVPLGFVAIPEDIATAVLYLVSEDSRYLIESELIVKGGAVLL